jgi:hypothetical protein
MSMNRKVTTLAVSTAFAALGLLGAATAHADPNGAYSGPKGDHSASALWVDLQPIHPPADYTAAEMEKLATVTCAELQGGENKGQIIESWTKGDPSTVTGGQAIVSAITWHFCPEYY